MGNILHTGLPKAGSTHLQRLLSRNKSICYYHHEALAWDDERWRLEQAEWSSNSPVVVSHEGLGCSARAQLLFQILDNPTVLVVTRNAFDWVESYYKRAVCNGDARAFPEWIAEVGQSLVRSVDFERQARFWEDSAGAQVALVPFELLTRDPRQYAETINAALDQKLVNPDLSDVVVNQSIDGECVEFVRRINALLMEMIDNHNAYGGKILKNLKGLPVKYPELTQFFMADDGTLNVKSVSSFIGVMTKALIQSVPENQQLIRSSFAGGAEASVSRELISDAMGETISRNYDFLKRFSAYEPVVDTYR